VSDFDVEDAPQREKVQALHEEEFDLFATMLSGKAITKTFETARGTFKIRFPTGRDRIRIDQLKAIRRNGLPATAFDVSAMYNNEVFSTLDVIIMDGPDWWKKAREKDQNWSWEDCPDEELVIELYRLVDSFRRNVQERLQQARSPGSVELSGPGEPATPMADGAFSGIADRSAPKGNE